MRNISSVQGGGYTEDNIIGICRYRHFFSVFFLVQRRQQRHFIFFLYIYMELKIITLDLKKKSITCLIISNRVGYIHYFRFFFFFGFFCVFFSNRVFHIISQGYINRTYLSELQMITHFIFVSVSDVECRDQWVFSIGRIPQLCERVLVITCYKIVIPVKIFYQVLIL